MRYTLNPAASLATLANSPSGLLDIPTTELWACHDRFVDLIPDRIAALTTLIDSGEDYSDWIPDASTDSLKTVGNWLQAHATSRPVSGAENDITNQRFWHPLPLPAEDLSEYTMSFVTDIGMYLSTVMLRHLPDCRWHLVLNDRRSINYGQSVLTAGGVKSTLTLSG